MTTQEAIKMLNGDINYWKNKNTLIDTEHYKMAIRSLEATEALEQTIEKLIKFARKQGLITEHLDTFGTYIEDVERITISNLRKAAKDYDKEISNKGE